MKYSSTAAYMHILYSGDHIVILPAALQISWAEKACDPRSCHLIKSQQLLAQPHSAQTCAQHHVDPRTMIQSLKSEVTWTTESSLDLHPVMDIAFYMAGFVCVSGAPA